MTSINQISRIRVVCINVESLRKRGINSLQEWTQNPAHLYIGRSNPYVVGALESKWANPFRIRKEKFSRTKSLLKYEDHIRENLWTQLNELMTIEELGCWCHPDPCHGDILVKLRNEYIKTLRI